MLSHLTYLSLHDRSEASLIVPLLQCLLARADDGLPSLRILLIEIHVISGTKRLLGYFPFGRGAARLATECNILPVALAGRLHRLHIRTCPSQLVIYDSAQFLDLFGAANRLEVIAVDLNGAHGGKIHLK